MNELQNYWLSEWDNVVVKVWSNILVWNEGSMDSAAFWVSYVNMYNIVNSVDYLMKLWLNVFLVSSWAVAMWKNDLKNYGITYSWELNDDQKAFLSSRWQVKLMCLYDKLFSEKEILITQDLLTHNDFLLKKRLGNIKNIFEENIISRTLPIINENDVISREELKFSDNDQLAWLVAKIVNAKILFLLTDVNGLYKNHWELNQELIKTVNNVENVRKYANSKVVEWSHWKWLMDSKLDVMADMMKNKILWILAHWWEIDIIRKIMEMQKVDKTIFSWYNHTFS